MPTVIMLEWLKKFNELPLVAKKKVSKASLVLPIHLQANNGADEPRRTQVHIFVTLVGVPATVARVLGEIQLDDVLRFVEVIRRWTYANTTRVNKHIQSAQKKDFQCCFFFTANKKPMHCQMLTLHTNVVLEDWTIFQSFRAHRCLVRKL